MRGSINTSTTLLFVIDTDVSMDLQSVKTFFSGAKASLYLSMKNFVTSRIKSKTLSDGRYCVTSYEEKVNGRVYLRDVKESAVHYAYLIASAVLANSGTSRFEYHVDVPKLYEKMKDNVPVANLSMFMASEEIDVANVRKIKKRRTFKDVLSIFKRPPCEKKKTWGEVKQRGSPVVLSGPLKTLSAPDGLKPVFSTRLFDLKYKKLGVERPVDCVVRPDETDNLLIDGYTPHLMYSDEHDYALMNKKNVKPLRKVDDITKLSDCVRKPVVISGCCETDE